MSSIFIWKSDRPVPKKTICIYSGSNWVLEEGLRSYKYIGQTSFGNVIMFRIENMPTNWVGSDLLEMNQVPYELMKHDNNGIFEQLGEWFRFISNETDFNAIKSFVKL